MKPGKTDLVETVVFGAMEKLVKLKELSDGITALNSEWESQSQKYTQELDRMVNEMSETLKEIQDMSKVLEANSEDANNTGPAPKLAVVSDQAENRPSTSMPKQKKSVPKAKTAKGQATAPAENLPSVSGISVAAIKKENDTDIFTDFYVRMDEIGKEMADTVAKMNAVSKRKSNSPLATRKQKKAATDKNMVQAQSVDVAASTSKVKVKADPNPPKSQSTSSKSRRGQPKNVASPPNAKSRKRVAGKSSGGKPPGKSSSK